MLTPEQEARIRAALPPIFRNLPIGPDRIVVGETKDGIGRIGNIKLAFTFGQQLSTDRPGPFSTVVLARLMVLRSKIAADRFAADRFAAAQVQS